ncbi:MAG: lasso peptide biosynthesis B2 protein [Pseudolabrys sp.]
MARLRSIRRLAVRFGQIGSRRRALVAEAVLGLMVARLALALVPFPKLARRLGRFVPPDEARRLAATPRRNGSAQIATDIGWAVTRAARYVPFKAVCLPQAMAARVMLERRGVASTMHFGAAKGEEKPFDSHAWLDAAGVEVTGYPVAKGFSEIACFV